MKYSILFLCVSLMFGCSANPNLSGRYPFEVEKISETEYYVEFYGTPLNTFEEAREEWDYKAQSVCQGEYQYKKDKESAICSTNNKPSCITESTSLLDSGPVVRGFAICASSDEPKIIYSSIEENKDSSELKEILIVKQLEKETYFVEFAGLPDGSIEQARVKWNERASITCNGRSYDSKLSKNSMWQEDIKASGKGFSLKNSGGGGSEVMRDIYCSGGGALDCMIASLMHSIMSSNKSDIAYKEKKGTTFDEEVRFPVVEGRVFCK